MSQQATVTERDIAAVNLDLAEGLPGSEGVDKRACLRKLDEWAARVRSETSRMLYLFRRHRSRFDNSFQRYKAEVLVTILQRDLGVHYRQELIDLPDHEFFKDAKNLFVHGVITGHGGTCNSLPVAFAAVGRRLGYPLRIVSTFEHVFVRWDEPGAVRFNIECTSRGFLSHPDEHYLEWPRKLSPEQVRRWGTLRSLSEAEEEASFHCNRGICSQENGDLRGAVRSYATAAELDPGEGSYESSLENAMGLWEVEQRRRLMPGFPPLRVVPSFKKHLNLTPVLAGRLAFLTARGLMLSDPRLEDQWWGPLRRDPTLRPPRIPALAVADFNGPPGQDLTIAFHDAVPPEYGPVADCITWEKMT